MNLEWLNVCVTQEDVVEVGGGLFELQEEN